MMTVSYTHLFKKMKNNGVQFSINEDTIYKVKLTEHGKELFKLRYLERPNPLPESEEDKSIYYFNCSKTVSYTHLSELFP